MSKENKFVDFMKSQLHRRHFAQCEHFVVDAPDYPFLVPLKSLKYFCERWYLNITFNYKELIDTLTLGTSSLGYFRCECI